MKELSNFRYKQAKSSTPHAQEIICEISCNFFDELSDLVTTLLFSTVDVTVYYNGFHGDLNETLFVGEVDEESKKLVKITHECLAEAIKLGKAW